MHKLYIWKLLLKMGVEKHYNNTKLKKTWKVDVNIFFTKFSNCITIIHQICSVNNGKIKKHVLNTTKLLSMQKYALYIDDIFFCLVVK